MLTAYSPNGNCRVFAKDMSRGMSGFVCPSCQSPVILKRGHIRIPHFAHLPDTLCAEGVGETERHYQCKQSVYDALKVHPDVTDADIEVCFPGVRADIYAVIRGYRVAIELQRSNLSVNDLERRTHAYSDLGIFCVWVVAHTAIPENDVRYSPRDWERWLHALGFGRVYYWNDNISVLPVHFSPYQLWVKESEWYDEDGDFRSAGGYYRKSRRYRTPLHGQSVSLISEFGRSIRDEWTCETIHIPKSRLWIDTQERWWDIYE